MQHYLRICVLCTLLAGASCNRNAQHRFDIQKELVSLGVKTRQVSFNPSLLTPFLDDSNIDEAALKHFLKTVRDVHIYSIPTQEVLYRIAESARKSNYVRELDLRQGDHRMLVYANVSEGGDNISSLLLLLFEPHNTFYAIDMNGVISRSSLAQLNNISPAFFETYIRRFNIVF